MPSTGDEVEAAFRKLALKYHPDKGGDGNNWLRLQAARNYLRDMLAKKEQAAEDPVSKAKGRLPWLGCYCDVCLPSIMKMAICKGCLVGGGHTCGVLTQMSGRFSKEAKAFMVVKRTHDAMSEQAAITDWRRKVNIDKEAHKELSKMETLKRKQDREQAELDAWNDVNKMKSAAQEMAEDLFEAKHSEPSPSKKQRLAGLSATCEEQLAIPSFERLPYQTCPKCGYDVGFMRDKFRDGHLYMFCKRGRRECAWKTVVPLASLQEPSSSARHSTGHDPRPKPSARPEPTSLTYL